MMMTCREVSRWIAGDGLDGASWTTRLAVRLHHLLCRHCRRYARQIRVIGSAAREHWRSRADDPEARQRLHDRLDKNR